MKFCKDCGYFMKIANTDECGEGICAHPALGSYHTANINHSCAFWANSITCYDCAHFGNDYACLTAQENDDARQCCGFDDRRYYELLDILRVWMTRGDDYQEKIDKAIEEAKTFL